MISAFTILFAMALVSLMLHRSNVLKPLSLLALLWSLSATFQGFVVPLAGFGSHDQIQLFEMVLEIVLFATLLHERNDTTITQILFLGAASVLLLQSQTLLGFIVSFEAVSIVSVVLVSYITTKQQAQGAVKMFIASSLATGILLLGASFYVMGGGVLLEMPSDKSSFFMNVGMFVMLAGVFYKLTIVPFHSWAVDAYSLVRHSHTALLSGVAKTVAVLAVFKIFAPFLSAHLPFAVPLLATLAVVTMTFGNLLALFSNNIAKILTYSSIAHAGYMLVAFVVLQSSYADEGILYMAIAYIFMQSATFLVLDSMKTYYNVQTLQELKGFVSQSPLLAFFFSFQLLSLAGIPLLAGFLAKAVVFYASVDAGLWWLALIALLNSALSVGYYGWLIKTIYFDRFDGVYKSVIGMRLPIMAQLLLMVGTLFFGIYAGAVFGQ